jgi:hypothetical protein
MELIFSDSHAAPRERPGSEPLTADQLKLNDKPTVPGDRCHRPVFPITSIVVPDPGKGGDVRQKLCLALSRYSAAVALSRQQISDPKAL